MIDSYLLWPHESEEEGTTLHLVSSEVESMSRVRWLVGSGRARCESAHVPDAVQRIARSYPARASHTGHGSTAS
jgi:hypothetical protein